MTISIGNQLLFVPYGAHVIGIGLILRLSLGIGVGLILLATVYERFTGIPEGPASQRVPFGQVRALGLFLFTNAALTSLCYASLVWWRDRRPYFPYASPFLTFIHFWDLVAYQFRMPYLHTVQFFKPGITFPWQYPPSIALLYVPILITGYPGLVFSVVVALGLLFLAFRLAQRLSAEGLRKLQAYAFVIAVLLISYPFWFEMSLGNMEIFIFFLVAAGLLCFSRGSVYASAVLIGLAAGMKIFPGVYFGLLLQRKQYKQIAVGLVTAVVSNVAGLWLICPDLRYGYRQVQAGLAYNKQFYILTRLQRETGFDHSIFGLMKQIAYKHFGVHLPPALFTGYMAVVAIAGIAIYFLRIRKMPVTNQIAALCVASILLPPTSHDYTLIHLYIPWAMLAVLAVRSYHQHRTLPGLTGAMICFGILFSSESEVIRHGSAYSGQIKCLVLVILFYIVLRYPWTSGVAQTDEPTESSSWREDSVGRLRTT